VTAHRLVLMTDEELGAAVRALEPSLVSLAVPDVVAGTLDTIRSGRRPRRRFSRRARIVILIAAALLTLAAAAAASKLVVDLGGIRIERTSGAPALPTSPVVPATFGRSISLDAAGAAAGFTPAVPPDLGPPDRVWLLSEVTSFEPFERGVVVTMAWLPGPGLPRVPGTTFGATLMQFRGEANVATKLVDRPFQLVSGFEAYWITAPHRLDLLTPTGVRSFRVEGNILLWQEGDTAFRLETDLSKHQALRLAGLVP
jgi:hypothetical protein